MLYFLAPLLPSPSEGHSQSFSSSCCPLTCCLHRWPQHAISSCLRCSVLLPYLLLYNSHTHTHTHTHTLTHRWCNMRLAVVVCCAALCFVSTASAKDDPEVDALTKALGISIYLSIYLYTLKSTRSPTRSVCTYTCIEPYITY